MAQIEQLRSAFELKMEEAKADAKFLLEPDGDEETVKRLAQKFMELRNGIDKLKISETRKETLRLKLDDIGTRFGPKYELTKTEDELKQFEDYLQKVKNGKVEVQETIIKKETSQTKKEQEKHENLREFLDATENNPAWQGKSRRERANAFWK
jgi:hypothetical protein